ncbi:uncharacterized protein LOC111374732 [Olea europaea subsp. europaea]|uniref:Uncharacterized protein LOC111374732 n=1 Tax=Olea europaea subsp. europaea TaxID=158383 RepID=A0A8S0V304_OLEEU|nr:uncharacterized protein LOC111374732 [Olea europaea subsp. europaea]
MAIVSKFNVNRPNFTNKLCKSLIVSGFILYIFYTLLSNHPCCYSSTIFTRLRQKDPKYSDPPLIPTNLSHVVFGIAGSSKTWRNRRWYVETWWRPNISRGYLFVDRFPIEFLPWPPSLPPFRIYQNTSRYKKYDKHPIPQAIRMTHLILDTFKAENEGVRWYILADDDTVFFINNLADVLARYDHNEFFYIGMNSESHASNVYHSFDMAFGGAGYALSYPLAKAVVNNLDVCIKRYPTLYGSDHIVQSCVADLGVSLTREKGFHQVDVHSDISGLLSAHPQAPLVSLHHLVYVDPIFPYMNHKESLNHLMEAVKIDESRLLQQSICYHKPKNWSVSISWGIQCNFMKPSSFQACSRDPSRRLRLGANTSGLHSFLILEFPPKILVKLHISFSLILWKIKARIISLPAIVGECLQVQCRLAPRLAIILLIISPKYMFSPLYGNMIQLEAEENVAMLCI